MLLLPRSVFILRQVLKPGRDLCGVHPCCSCDLSCDTAWGTLLAQMFGIENKPHFSSAFSFCCVLVELMAVTGLKALG